MQEIIVIVGPTGVGKTKLSIELAKRLNGEIINGDSVSIYKRLNVGSAKATDDERAAATHHLIDIRDLNDDYSVFDYQKDCRSAIDEIIRKGKTPIIVGGTGLYIKASLYDYRFEEEEKENNLYEELTNEEILNKIKKYNISNHPDINNRRRLVRLLNKLEHDVSISNNKDKLLYDAKVIGLTTNRDELYERINDRVDKMMNNGLLDEVLSLKEYYVGSRILNSAIGYKEFKDYLFGNKSIEEVVFEIKKNTRRFAKRQYTFFNNQFNVNWFNVDFENFDNTIDAVVAFFND